MREINQRIEISADYFCIVVIHNVLCTTLRVVALSIFAQFLLNPLDTKLFTDRPMSNYLKKMEKIQITEKMDVIIILKFEHGFIIVMHPKDADGMTSSVDQG